MNKLNRRQFLDRSAVAGAGLAAGAWMAHAAPTFAANASTSPNEKIRIAIIGVRGRGSSLALSFATRPDCEVAYLADVDTSLFTAPAPSGYIRYFDKSLEGPRVAGVERAQGKPPQTVQDFRRVLDDKSVDAVVVATPDHWHALATVWACQAGKHVYVEKPASYCPWEGRKMVEAARKYERVVQVGFQSRSGAYMHEAKKYIDEGKLDTIHLCRVYSQKMWPNVPARPDDAPPAPLDWDMWNGPAPQTPYNYNVWEHWNHYWQYSGGDIVNDAPHQLDLARWLIGKDYPSSVYSVGGRFGDKEGAYETPDTQMALYEFGDCVMSFENTQYTWYMPETSEAERDGDIFPHWLQNTSRIELFGTKGLMIVGRHGGGWQVFVRPKDQQPQVAAQAFGRWCDLEHVENFCQAIRGSAKPNCDIEQGHRSTLLAQYANISYRLGGQKLLIDAASESFVSNDKANAMLKRAEYREPWVMPQAV